MKYDDMERDTALLSDDELDFVSGGEAFFDTEVGQAFLTGILSTCGQAGYAALTNSFIKAQR